MDQAFPREAYLKKVGLAEPPAVSEIGLAELHRAQCLRIPFENIDPFLGRPVSLRPEDLAAKLLGKRGGYCFELNSFFLQALRAFGFRARPLVGRVFMGRPGAGPRTHQAVLVELAGRPWLADVGFGGPGLFEPIPFEPGYSAEQGGRRIRLSADPDWGMVYEDEMDGAWRRIYALPDERVEPVDLELGNHYCATHPASIFRANLYCALARPGGGRVTLYNRSSALQEGGVRTERALRAGELGSFLRGQLGLDLAAEEEAALERRLGETGPKID